MNSLSPSAPRVMGRRQRRAGHQADDLGGGDGHDGQIVGPEPKRGQTEDQSKDRRETHPDHDREERIESPQGHGQAHSVGAHGDEADLPEVEQTRISEVDVEPDGGQGVEDRVEIECLVE